MKILMPILLLLIAPSIVHCVDMAPHTYFEIEIRARQLTLDGMEARLLCMQNDCPESELHTLDQDNFNKVLAMHEEYGTTPSRLSGWYSNHMQETEGYLLNNPQIMIRLDELETSFEALSDAIKTLAEVQ